MIIRVLVVDDSRFFRRRITEILEIDPNLEVVDTAENGSEAVAKVKNGKFDVVVMDIEMPVMDGITAVRQIMDSNPLPILMFSSLTKEGAQPTFDALEAGALDYLPKRFDDISKNSEEAKEILRTRVREISRKGYLARSSRSKAGVSNKRVPAQKDSSKRTVRPSTEKIPSNAKLIAIGTSTGGPVALQVVLAKIPANFPLPIIMIQHMPGTFTPAFAQRLNQLCNITVKEAENGEILKPSVAYLAPGGKQMVLKKRAHSIIIQVEDGAPELNYKPCVDISFQSAAEMFSGKVLGIVLTGMGSDGREGSRKLRETGASIWAQDEESCVIFGMPSSVIEAGLADQVLSLSEIGSVLARGA